MTGRGRPSRATVYRRLDTAIQDLRHRLGGLPTPQEAAAVWDDIWHLEAHHSTALEGNTLVLREVEALLEKQRPVGNKPLREYLEVQGYGDAARWVYAQAHDRSRHDDLVTVDEVRHIHHLAMTPVWAVAPHDHAGADEGPGSFRRHDIAPFGGGMQPPSWPLVGAELRQWVHEACALATSGGEEGAWPERVALVHAAFERVHPFLDGNGRTGRLVLNLVLVRLGQPPIIVLKRQRSAYLAALAKADGGDPGPLGEIMARAITDNLNRFIIPSIAGPARMVPLAALVTPDATLVALRHAARRGRLEAHQDADGTWRSSRRAVDHYLASRFRRPRG